MPVESSDSLRCPGWRHLYTAEGDRLARRVAQEREERIR